MSLRRLTEADYELERAMGRKARPDYAPAPLTDTPSAPSQRPDHCPGFFSDALRRPPAHADRFVPDPSVRAASAVADAERRRSEDRRAVAALPAADEPSDDAPARAPRRRP